MGCGASTPVKEDGRRQSSSSTQKAPPGKAESQRKPKLDVGPHYRLIKHLGKLLKIRCP